jgi:hypothetical protein
MTKHGFLDKIKSTAAIIDTTRRKPKDNTRNEDGQNEKAAAKWDALKDDFMMKPKKVCTSRPVASILSFVLQNVPLTRRILLDH